MHEQAGQLEGCWLTSWIIFWISMPAQAGLTSKRVTAFHLQSAGADAGY